MWSGKNRALNSYLYKDYLSRISYNMHDQLMLNVPDIITKTQTDKTKYI